MKSVVNPLLLVLENIDCSRALMLSSNDAPEALDKVLPLEVLALEGRELAWLVVALGGGMPKTCAFKSANSDVVGLAAALLGLPSAAAALSE
jgi:hypothetical protein